MPSSGHVPSLPESLILHNCKVWLGGHAQLSFHSRLDAAGRLMVEVLMTIKYDDHGNPLDRALVLSASGDNLERCFAHLHNESARRVDKYIQAYGYRLPQKPSYAGSKPSGTRVPLRQRPKYSTPPLQMPSRRDDRFAVSSDLDSMTGEAHGAACTSESDADSDEYESASDPDSDGSKSEDEEDAVPGLDGFGSVKPVTKPVLPSVTPGWHHLDRRHDNAHLQTRRDTINSMTPSATATCGVAPTTASHRRYDSAQSYIHRRFMGRQHQMDETQRLLLSASEPPAYESEHNTDLGVIGSINGTADHQCTGTGSNSTMRLAPAPPAPFPPPAPNGIANANPGGAVRAFQPPPPPPPGETEDDAGRKAAIQSSRQPHHPTAFSFPQYTATPLDTCRSLSLNTGASAAAVPEKVNFSSQVPPLPPRGPRAGAADLPSGVGVGEDAGVGVGLGMGMGLGMGGPMPSAASMPFALPATRSMDWKQGGGSHDGSKTWFGTPPPPPPAWSVGTRTVKLNINWVGVGELKILDRLSCTRPGILGKVLSITRTRPWDYMTTKNGILTSATPPARMGPLTVTIKRVHFGTETYQVSNEVDSFIPLFDKQISNSLSFPTFDVEVRS